MQLFNKMKERNERMIRTAPNGLQPYVRTSDNYDMTNFKAVSLLKKTKTASKFRISSSSLEQVQSKFEDFPL